MSVIEAAGLCSLPRPRTSRACVTAHFVFLDFILGTIPAVQDECSAIHRLAIEQVSL